MSFLESFWEHFGLHVGVPWSPFGAILGSRGGQREPKGSPGRSRRSPGEAKREPRDVILRKSGLIRNVCFSLVLIGSGAHGGGRRAPKDDQEELGWYLWGQTLRKREHRIRKNTDV